MEYTLDIAQLKDALRRRQRHESTTHYSAEDLPVFVPMLTSTAAGGLGSVRPSRPDTPISLDAPLIGGYGQLTPQPRCNSLDIAELPQLHNAVQHCRSEEMLKNESISTEHMNGVHNVFHSSPSKDDGGGVGDDDDDCSINKRLVEAAANEIRGGHHSGYYTRILSAAGGQKSHTHRLRRFGGTHRQPVINLLARSRQHPTALHQYYGRKHGV